MREVGFQMVGQRVSMQAGSIGARHRLRYRPLSCQTAFTTPFLAKCQVLRGISIQINTTVNSSAQYECRNPSTPSFCDDKISSTKDTYNATRPIGAFFDLIGFPKVLPTEPMQISGAIESPMPICESFYRINDIGGYESRKCSASGNGGWTLITEYEN